MGSMRFIVLLICLILIGGCGKAETGGAVTRLVLSSGDEIENPTDHDIRDALRRLDIDRDGEAFAILERDEMTYVQVGGDSTRGFDAEYQDGDVARHYRAEREDFTLDEIVQMLGDYRDGDIDWSAYGDWSRITW